MQCNATERDVKRTFANLCERMQQIGLVAAGLVLVMAAGVVHGLWTNRWSDHAVLEAAGARLREVPRGIGDWTGEDQEIDPDRLARAEAAGSLLRTYTGPDGQKVSVVLLCGRFGPLAVHTP